MNMKSLFAFLSLLAATALAGAAEGKPVKIFIVSGQSNMTGRGSLGDLNKPAADQKATLLRFIMEPQNVEKYKFLYKDDGKKGRTWTVRDDVFITMGEWPHDGKEGHGKHGGFGPGYGGFRNKGLGPELGIGHALGDFHDEPVLLVKASFGANNLAVNFRPPSSGGTLGDKYPLIIKAVNDAIEHLPDIIPDYQKKTGYEIAGFFWNQGEHDGTPEAAAEYEQNLANLITDLRKDLKAPDMKAVIAVTGFGGRGAEGEGQLKVIAAQLAVPLRPEFKGTVATGDETLRQRANQTANYITYYLQPDNRIVVGFQYNQWWYSCHAGVILYLLDFAEAASASSKPVGE